jgi:Gas vesicle synthesis protein GvpL/GvpF
VTTSPRPAGEAGTGWYVYGVVPAAEAPQGLFDGVGGVGGGTVQLIPAGQLAAVATDVPLEEFGEASITDNLRDPAWLESRVRAHEAVLEAALRAVPVVPFRFGVIYRNENAVREMLGAHEGLGQALDGVRGKVELGVKAFLAADSAGAPQSDEGEETSAGRRYLEEKRRTRRLAEEREALKASWADESHRRLAALADAATANPLQPGEVTGRDDEMFLNGAYLVPVEHEGKFRQLVAELEAEFRPNVQFELTGPWPPYNFVEDPA